MFGSTLPQNRARMFLLAAFAVVISVFAVFAQSAAANVSISGTATVAVEPSFTETLAAKGVTPGIPGVLRITGGKIAQANGRGSYQTSGGFTFKTSKKSTFVNALRFIRGGTSSVSANVGGETITAFAASQGVVSRSGFNTNVSSITLRLSAPGAARLNAVLGLKKKKVAFKSNQLVAVVELASVARLIEVAKGGALRIQLDASAQTTLADAAVSLTAASPAKNLPESISIPGTGGGFLKRNTLTGSVFLRGGLAFKRGSTSLKIGKPTFVQAKHPYVQFTRANGSKIKFFHVNAGGRKVDEATRHIELTPLHLTLTKDGADLLNKTFKAKLFTQNSPMGVATLDIYGK